MDIRLTDYEFAIAIQIGTYRQLSNLKKGRKDAYGAPSEDGLNLHIQGACGESAVAKALNIYWSGNMGKLKACDVNHKKHKIEVRTRSKDWYELIIHEKDNDDAIFILVTGVAPNFKLVGWCFGRDGKKQKYLKDPTGYRPPAFFVPQDDLQNMKRLFKGLNINNE